MELKTIDGLSNFAVLVTEFEPERPLRDYVMKKRANAIKIVKKLKWSTLRLLLFLRSNFYNCDSLIDPFVFCVFLQNRELQSTSILIIVLSGIRR